EPEVRVELPVTPVSLDPSALLLEGARRTDERARIAAQVPDRDAIFAPAPDAPCTTDGALDQERVEARLAECDEVLTPTEARIVSLVDGARDATQLADLACVVEFE